MPTKKIASKGATKISFNWKKFAFVLFFVIGLGGYFSYFNSVVEQPSINYLATGLDPEEAAYLQKAIVAKPATPVKTTTKNVQYGAEPTLVVPNTPAVNKPATKSSPTPVPNGIESEEAAFIQKVINKDNTNSTGTAPAPVVSVTTQDANGNIYTAPIVLNKPTEEKGTEKSVDSIASEIKQEVIDKATSVPATTSRLQKELALLTQRRNDLRTNSYGDMTRPLFCEPSPGYLIPQGVNYFDSHKNICYRCGIIKSGGSVDARLFEINRCSKAATGCYLYQKVDESGNPLHVFSTSSSSEFKIAIYYPADGKAITFPDGSGSTTKRCKPGKKDPSKNGYAAPDYWQ